ncbi:hypothetical protein BJY52DRAFT_721874 [Lactarius psammicola]|nr:hypothetical protein BJY52DRAFT_721874 [Lactarius psammicola]
MLTGSYVILAAFGSSGSSSQQDKPDDGRLAEIDSTVAIVRAALRVDTIPGASGRDVQPASMSQVTRFPFGRFTRSDSVIPGYSQLDQHPLKKYVKRKPSTRININFRPRNKGTFVTIREPFCYCCPPLLPLRRYLRLRSVTDPLRYLCRSLTDVHFCHARNPR